MALIDRLLGRPTPEEVVREQGPAVLRQLRRMFGPRADVDDVFQAVMVEVLRSLPTFAGRSQLKTWIHRITLNVAYQEMRLQYRERATTPLDDATEPVSEENVETKLLDHEALTQLYEGLGRLDPKKRMAVLLHDIEGLPLREISERVGRPLQTVNSQLRAGRAELAAFLAERRRSASEARGAAPDSQPGPTPNNVRGKGASR
jgi:RNA polymerase sigma-70 factor (ECF subfamily)